VRDDKLRSPSNAEVKNEWNYTSNPPTRLRDVHCDNFTFSPSRQLMFRYLPGQNEDDMKYSSQRASHIRNKNLEPLVAQWLRYCATVGDRGSTVVKVLRYSGGPR
jgi:uncharacterized protein YqiB (DUF1249 family)